MVHSRPLSCSCAPFFFFFNDTATTEIYTLSLHDALPIFPDGARSPGAGSGRRDVPHPGVPDALPAAAGLHRHGAGSGARGRSEEHTSELQSQSNLVCRLLLEKKKETKITVVM